LGNFGRRGSGGFPTDNGCNSPILCCGLSLINRRRFEEILQQRLATTTVEIAAVNTRENRLDAIAIGSIQERILTLEKAQLQQQITQLQQWVTDLDDRLEELGDRDLELKQVQQQLAALQKYNIRTH
jgi:hypothetical protein